MTEKYRNRLVLVMGMALGVGVVVWAIKDIPRTPKVQAQVEKIIHADEFILDDENGKPCAALTSTKDGPQLNLSDENGTIRIALVVAKGGSGLALLDENGQPRATLLLTTNGPALTLADENGVPRNGLTVNKEKSQQPEPGQGERSQGQYHPQTR